MLDGFSAFQAALALVRGHLVYLAQLLHQPLLVGCRQASKVGVAAQKLFLILKRNVSVVIEPVLKVTGRGEILAYFSVVRRRAAVCRT